MDPKGKVALLTGGARIGQAVAQELAQRGCSLALTWRGSRETAEATAQAARLLGVRALTCQADARDETQVADAVERCARDLGRLDILVNMASTYVGTTLAALGAKAWAEAIDSNARSAFLFSLKAAPHMKQAGAG